jgi:hypothetical protein
MVTTANIGSIEADGVCKFDQTKVNLLPASLPEKDLEAVIQVCICQFGLRLDTCRVDFIRFFKKQFTAAKWGNESLAGVAGLTETNPIIDKRLTILINIVNDFFKQAKPNNKVPPLAMAEFYLSDANGYEASYGPKDHNMAFSAQIILKSFTELQASKFTDAYIAHILYHEMRHAEQFLFITRFMLARGQKVSGKGISPSLVAAAPTSDKSDLVQQGTAGKIIKGHRHYHCTVRLYASAFGDPDSEEEKSFKPNIYEDPDYVIPKSLRSSKRNEYNQESIAAKTEHARLKQEALSKVRGDIMSKEAAIAHYEPLLTAQNGANKEALEKYKTLLAEEADAYACGDPIITLYATVE